MTLDQILEKYLLNVQMEWNYKQQNCLSLNELK